MKQEKLLIFDTTLRDGEQSPGASMTCKQKLQIAELLDAMGVDIIEAGFPIASEGDFLAVSEIAKNIKRASICGLARANIGDIDRCWEAVKHSARPRIHTFIGISPLHREFQVRLNKAEVINLVQETIRHARNLCDDVQWSPMDSTRTEPDYLCQAVEAAIKAGATTINVPDTVGYAIPQESAQIIKMLLERVPGADKVCFATHCHNDLGMATANSLVAVQAGARQVECTINGLGERAGNTALEEIVMAFHVRGDVLPYRTDIDTKKIIQISRVVSSISGFPVQFNKAIVGKNAFVHESGIHQDGVIKNASTFEIVNPEDIGLNTTNLFMGKHSGRAALKAKMHELGFDFEGNQLNSIFIAFKALADQKKEIYDDDLLALIRDTSISNDEFKDRLHLDSLAVTCGIMSCKYAELALLVDGERKQIKAKGDGPIDATFKAIQSLFPHNAQLQLYQVQAVTEGTDAQGTVNVRLEGNNRIVTGQASDTDIVVASAKAYINALNKLEMFQESIKPETATP